MKTGEQIYLAYHRQRDHSGSAIDKYAQDLDTFFFHASVQNETDEFYKLLEEADRLDKQLSYEDRDPTIMWDDYPIDGIILIDREF